MSLNPEQVDIRRTHLRDQESASPEHRYWLSFCDPDLPEGSRVLGVAIVVARGVVSASERAWELGCNPGGEVLSMELPDELPIEPTDIDRLLSVAESRALIAAIEASL